MLRGVLDAEGGCDPALLPEPQSPVAAMLGAGHKPAKMLLREGQLSLTGGQKSVYLAAYEVHLMTP